VRIVDVVYTVQAAQGPFYSVHAAQLANPTSAKRKGIKVGKMQVQ